MRVADDLGVGATVADFRVESPLGRGGMSTVYRARDLRLRRRVALKVLASPLAADEEFRDRFLRESELAASIDHPHIVPIYQAGEDGDLLFIAMRYVTGRDLKARLRDRWMQLAEATALLAQVAEALDAAHARGLVHRDVKPSNILLEPGTGPDGADHAYLADFGITTRLGDRAGGVDGGALVGTIDYVAPEQIAGGVVDGRADVYSLGCVLFECLVGEPPFRRDTDVQVVFAHLDADPPAISERRPELPPALDAVIARALAKEPAERYPSCRELTGAASAVVVDRASRNLTELTGRAAAGRHELRGVETELAGNVLELQSARGRVQELSGAATPAGVRDETVCPYKGLASFERTDAEYFFGRERLIAELVARLAGSTFLGIVGPSGSGKSSVLRAGLVPALAAGVLPDSENWRTVLIRPGDRPPQELQRILATAADGPLLLVVDQLEELFTVYDSDQERAAFVDALAFGPATVVVALRADFYGRIAAYPALADRMGTDHVLVGPMRESELRRVIEGPAGRMGLRVEPELVDQLVDDVTGETGALPLLSTALVELWQHRDNDTLSLAAYHDHGGVRGAIARLAEAGYAKVPAEDRPLVRAIMLRLVGEHGGDAAVRRRAPLAELDLGRTEVAGVLAALVDGRLVTVAQDGVELAHEALLQQWPRLRGWIEEDAAGRRLRRHLTHAAREWDRSGHDLGELYRGTRLAATLDWTADHAVELNALEREFIDSSRDAAQREARRSRRTNRRLRGLLAAVAVFLVAALVGGTLAVIQRGHAQLADDRARGEETARFAQRLGAQSLLEENLDLSLLLARQAVAISDTPQTRASLLTALAKAPSAIGIMTVDDRAIGDVALTPDGTTLAVLADSKISFFDTRTYQRVGEPVTDTWLGSLAYSPDGRILAYAGGSGTGASYLRLIDADTHAELATVFVAGTAARLAFSGDGTRLIVVTTGLDEPVVVMVRDTTTLDDAAPSIDPVGSAGCGANITCWAGHVAVTPDGRTVLASNGGELAWWDLETGRRTRTLAVEPGLGVLAVSPDGRRGAVGTDSGIRVVDLDSGESRMAIGGPASSPNHLAFSPDGATVASVDADGTVTLWDAGSAAARDTLRGHASGAWRSVFSPDGTTLYTIGGDGRVIAWDLTGTRGVRHTFRLPGGNLGPPAPGPVRPGRFSPDGTLIAIGLRDRGIALWNAADLTPAGAPLMETGGEVYALDFSPDGLTVAAVSVALTAAGAAFDIGDGQLTVWDVAPTQSLRYPPIRVEPGIPGLAFGPSGTTLLTANPTGVQTWDVATGAGVGRPVTTSWASGLSVSADGTRAAVALRSDSGSRALVWDIADGSPVVSVDVSPVAGDFAVALSPDGRTLAVGGAVGFLRLWDVETGELRREFDRVGAWPESLEFGPDGRSLAAAATLWDVATGNRIGPNLAAGHQTSVTDLSPDGHRLLITTPDGQAAIWDVDPASWTARACALANRALTADEWDRFLPGRPYEPACAP